MKTDLSTDSGRQSAQEIADQTEPDYLGIDVNYLEPDDPINDKYPRTEELFDVKPADQSKTPENSYNQSNVAEETVLADYLGFSPSQDVKKAPKIDDYPYLEDKSDSQSLSPNLSVKKSISSVTPPYLLEQPNTANSPRILTLRAKITTKTKVKDEMSELDDLVKQSIDGVNLLLEDIGDDFNSSEKEELSYRRVELNNVIDSVKLRPRAEIKKEEPKKNTKTEKITKSSNSLISVEKPKTTNRNINKQKSLISSIVKPEKKLVSINKLSEKEAGQFEKLIYLVEDAFCPNEEKVIKSAITIQQRFRNYLKNPYEPPTSKLYDHLLYTKLLTSVRGALKAYEELATHEGLFVIRAGQYGVGEARDEQMYKRVFSEVYLILWKMRLKI